MVGDILMAEWVKGHPDIKNLEAMKEHLREVQKGLKAERLALMEQLEKSIGIISARRGRDGSSSS
jgi:hypothetical protein